MNFARNDVHNLDDSALQHFSVNDEAFDEWHKEHFNSWIKKDKQQDKHNRSNGTLAHC